MEDVKVESSENNPAMQKGSDGDAVNVKESQYTLVDYGEKILSEMFHAITEQQKQVFSLHERVELLAEVVRAFVVLILPVTAGLGIAVLGKVYLPSVIGIWVFTVFIGLSVGVVFHNLRLLSDTIVRYQAHTVYLPQTHRRNTSSQSKTTCDMATGTCEADKLQ